MSSRPERIILSVAGVGSLLEALRQESYQLVGPTVRDGAIVHAEITEWMPRFDFPDLERDYEFVALRHPDEYPFCEGRRVSSRGLDIDIRDYDGHFAEEQAPYSSALRSRIRSRGAYLCGPLARFNLNFEQLFPEVDDLARRAGVAPPCRNPFRMLLVRVVKIAQVFTEAIRIIESYVPPGALFVETSVRAVTGYGGTEAPRGFLDHRYALDETGTILDATIVPPTSQNQLTIEEDLYDLAPVLAKLSPRGGHAPRGAGRAQLRPVHLVRDALSHPEMERE